MALDISARLLSVAQQLEPVPPGVTYLRASAVAVPLATATGEITDHVDGSVRRTVGRYFDEGFWDGPGLHAATLPVGAHHRTLSSYVNCLAEAGLPIEEMIEPVGVPDAPVWYQVPCLLYARCRRSS